MANKGKKELVYEGFTLPRLKIKELLASKARRDYELKNLHKQLDKEKEELETDFSKTRSQLLSRALDHQMLLEEQSCVDSNSDEEQRASEIENSADNYATCLETTSFSTLKDFSCSRVAVEENSYTHSSNHKPNHKQPWADKTEPVASKSQPTRKISSGGGANPYMRENWDAGSERFEQSLAAKSERNASKSQSKRKISWGGRSNAYMENWDAGTECSEPKLVASKSQHRRKISWGGRGNVYMDNWDVRSELSKASSEGNLSAEVTCPRGDMSHPRERKHTIGGRSFNSKSSVLTKEALQKHSFSTSKHLTRRHTVCSRPRRVELSPTEEENCPEQKSLSDLLPPVKLPPIYLQQKKSNKKGIKGDKSFVNTSVKVDISKSDDTEWTTRDLDYCRYLRITRTDSEEYPW